MMGIAFLVACRCNSCSFFYNVCTFAFGEINILLLLLDMLQMMYEYSGVISRTNLPPHIFAVSDSAFSSLCTDEYNQCCIISGESGAGKCAILFHLV